jgi:hypothetical protein
MLRAQGYASDELNEIRRILYGLPFYGLPFPNVTEEQLLERYRCHNREVKEYFSGRPNDLLVVNWRETNGRNCATFSDMTFPPVPSLTQTGETTAI